MEFQQEKYTIVNDSRASSILYRFLINKKNKGFLILPVNICPIVVDVSVKAGFTPIYVDINSDNLCLDLKLTSKLIADDNKIKGVLINHTYGVDFNFSDYIKKTKEEWGGFIIEDKCLSIPNIFDNINADLTLYSTGYAKYIELMYGGGIGVLTRTDSLSCEKHSILINDNCNLLINNFLIPIEKHLNDIEYAYKIIEKRKRIINHIYLDKLLNCALSPEFNNWRFNIIVNNKDKVIKEVFANNLFVSSHYRPLSDNKTQYKVAWDLYDNVINLFNDNYIDESNAKKLVQIIYQNINL